MRNFTLLTILGILLIGCATAFTPVCVTRSITVDKVTLPDVGSLNQFHFTITRGDNQVTGFDITASGQPVRTYVTEGGVYNVAERDYTEYGWKLLQGYPYTYCYEFGNSPLTTWFKPDAINMDIFQDVRCVFTNEALPNAVESSELTVASTPQGVHLSWQTYSETDIYGFDVLRAEVYNGEYHRINRYMLPSKSIGSSEGGAYEFIDTLVAKGETYFYRIMAVRADGGNDVLLDSFGTYMPVWKLWFPGTPR